MTVDKERNRAIDAIKGLMIILIILHHSRLLPFMHHGYLGVDVFFVISGFFLMRHFSAKKSTTAFKYTISRLRTVYLPYLFALLLACILDYKRLISFQGFEGFIETYSPFIAFLTLTEEIGFMAHSPVILVGGWYLSVLIIGGFLIYGLLQYNENLTKKVLLPLSIIFGFTFLFSYNSFSVENFSVVGMISLPLLRGTLEMGMGVLLFTLIQENQEWFNNRRICLGILSLVSLAVFFVMVMALKPIDGCLVIVIPLMLAGNLVSDSPFHCFYESFPTRVLPFIGTLSLELYLIHQPVIHIVHSGVALLHLPLSPVILVLLDFFFVIGVALLLRYLCRKLRIVKTDTV